MGKWVFVAKGSFLKFTSVHSTEFMEIPISLGKSEVKKDSECKKEMQNNTKRDLLIYYSSHS